MTSREKIHVPDAPSILGLAFRRFRGEDDYPVMVAVLERHNAADRIERAVTVEDVARTYTYLTNCDPYQDMLFAEVDGHVIGYNRVTWWKESRGNRIYHHFGFLVPEWRQQGIGRAMLYHSERRLHEIAADHPANGARFLESYAEDTQPGLESLLLREGYVAVRHGYDMVREIAGSLPRAPLPSGTEVRPVPPERYRALWAAMDEAFRDHWGYSPPTEEDYQEWLHEPTFQPELWQVAWDGDEIVGMVLNFIDVKENEQYKRQRGYTEGICVRRPWRRRGIARALLTGSFHLLRERGMTEAALGVDTQNPNGALQLYESVGFRPVKRGSTYRKPMS
ncbi:MAG: GNAT family N-acetyltransferase [Anaerolineae bacterium]|nr:GNAT family N-acetyltransferase [Anaerolineae bacterium]